MSHYAHRQRSGFIAIVLGTGAAVSLLLATNAGIGYVGWIAAALLLTLAVVFSSLTIAVADGFLKWQFGPGLIRKRVALDEIVNAETARTKFWEGWGIHLTTRGWLYNISGYDAVHVRMKTGKQFMLGTDQPEQLTQAINNAINTPGRTSP